MELGELGEPMQEKELFVCFGKKGACLIPGVTGICSGAQELFSARCSSLVVRSWKFSEFGSGGPINEPAG